MKKNLSLFAVAALFLAACNPAEPETKEGEDPAVHDELTLSKTEINVAAPAANDEITVTANCAWTVSNSLDWVSVQPASGKGDGTIKVSISENTGDDRSGSFTVHGGAADPISVSVTQSGAPSALAFGTPSLAGVLQVGQSGTCSVNIPYTGANGKESVEFTLAVESVYSNESNKGIESTAFTANSFTGGQGTLSIPVAGTPEVLGLVGITVNCAGEKLGEVLETRVTEKLPYSNYVVWNGWAAGYTRADFGYMIGGPFDKSWTNYGKDETLRASTNASDHIVLPTSYSSDDFKDAYLTAVAANPITAAGEVTLPKTTSGLGGYTFNPGIQIQGLLKDDYFLVAVPVKSVSKGAKVTVMASMGGAAAAAGYFVLEYSLDKTNWAEFPGVQTIVVSDTQYRYHFNDINSTDKTIRYTYSKDVAVDPGVASYTLEVPEALSNTTVYFRLRAVGLNGNSAVQAKGGWSDLKYLEIFIG